MGITRQPRAVETVGSKSCEMDDSCRIIKDLLCVTCTRFSGRLGQGCDGQVHQPRNGALQLVIGILEPDSGELFSV